MKWPTKIVWKHKEHILTDYYLGKRIQLTQHIPGLSIWAVSFHRRNSYVWRGLGHNETKPWYKGWDYTVIKTPKDQGNKATTVSRPFADTRLTFRFGKYIVTFCNIDRERYYRNSEILSVSHWGKVKYLKPEPVIEAPNMIQASTNPMEYPYSCPCERCDWGGDKTKDEIVNHVVDHAKQYELLETYYPDLTWRN